MSERERVIASRPSLEQVAAIVDFMEEHPALALGQLRGLEGRDTSKKLWRQLTKIVNSASGPTRPMKSWIKFWADKKSAVRAKVQAEGGNPCHLSSNLEKKIWDLFLANTEGNKRSVSSVKQESYLEDSFFNEDSMEHNHVELVAPEPVAYDEKAMDVDARHTAILEKLVKVMSEQSAAMSQLAMASHANTVAMERLAEASQIQARALDRLATSFESIGAATHDVRNAIVNIDASVKRYYSPQTYQTCETNATR